MVNIILSVVVIWINRKSLRAACWEVGPSERLLKALLPAVCLFGGAFLLALLTGFGNASQGSLPDLKTVISFVVVIPVIEELVFRIGFGGYLRKVGGVIWGGYFSALLFSMAHSFPTFERLMAGQSGIIWGPLFLGLFLEVLWSRTRNFWALCLFHGAANSTIFIFQYYDPRWFKWLEFLFS